MPRLVSIIKGALLWLSRRMASYKARGIVRLLLGVLLPLKNELFASNRFFRSF
jgi:hypothetical protein